MSTITKELAKLFRKITNSEIDAEGNAHVVLSPADSLLINNARIALASLEAEPVAWLLSGGGAKNDVRFDSSNAYADPLREVTPLYAAPQLPQPVVPNMAAVGEMPFLGTQENAFVSGWNACRAAMLQGKAEPVSQPYTLPAGYCVMPLKLTAANGAKGALSGEFHVTNRIVCQSCGGEGCEDCNEDGGWDAEIPIGWDTIKRIHEAAVEACALPAAPQQEVSK